jgi:hypothetical protein
MEILGGLSMDERIILKMFLMKQGLMAWDFSAGLVCGPVMGFCEHSHMAS